MSGSFCGSPYHATAFTVALGGDGAGVDDSKIGFFCDNIVRYVWYPKTPDGYLEDNSKISLMFAANPFALMFPFTSSTMLLSIAL